MGAGASVLKDIFESLSEGPIGQWLKPSMSEIGKTNSGRAVVNILKDQFEPEVAQTANFYRTRLNYTPVAAMRAAVDDTKDSYFGRRGEGVINFLKAVENEYPGGVAQKKIHVNNVANALDVYFGEKGVFIPNWRLKAMQAPYKVPLKAPYGPYKPPSDLEYKLRDVASWIFLPRIVIPHATQPLNVILQDGAKAFGDATAFMFNQGIDAAKRRIILSGALEDNIMFQYIDTMKGGGLARKLFHMPGFNYAREMQITQAALAGEFAVRDAFDEYVMGGRQLTPKLQMIFNRHGIDPTLPQFSTLQNLTPDMIRTAQYRGAQSTYFMRSTLDVPYPWSETWFARIATMYKHYSYNQGRFIIQAIHDSFKVSPEEGMKTIAILSTLYPMAGYAVASINNAMDLRPAPTNVKERDELYSQYLNAVGHAAGFGIAYSIFRSAKRNALADYAIGPIPSTITDFTQDVVNAASSESRRRALGRDVLRRIPFAGPGLAQELLPRKKAGRKSRVAEAY